MRLPYDPRPGQEALVSAIVDTHATYGHLVAEAGTGTGKTISALTGSIEATTVYATRTNSQQEQILAEHRKLRDAGEDVGLAIPIMGRKHYCPLLSQDERFQHGTPEELGRLCRDAKKKALQAHNAGEPVKGACSYYQRLLEDGPGPVEALLDSHDGDPASLAAKIADVGSCAYEAFKLLLPEARLVVLPTVFVIDDRLRQAVMDWMGKSTDQVRLIVDEAHHLPEAVRAHHSPRLGLATIERALKEAEEVDDPTLGGRVLATSLLTTLHEVIRELCDEHAPDSDDGWLPQDQTNETLMLRFGAPGPALERIAAELEDWGEAIRERRRVDGRLPRSYLGAVGSFLRFWLAERDAPYVHLVLREPRPALEAYLLDPAPKCRFLRDFASSIHISGTLAPVEEHRRLIGLPNTAVTLVQPSPFDPERLRLYGLLGVQRQHKGDAAIVAKQQDLARGLLQGWQGRMAVFFPSHQMLRDYVEEGFLHGLDAAVYEESPGMAQNELQAMLRRFRQDPAPRTILVGVLGGRLTEGVDYPGDVLEKMLILGVPYPRPSARSTALIHHFDREDGRGWKVAVHDPTGRTLRQAVGRLIRGPEDQGTAVILDDRVVRFRDHLPRLRMVNKVGDCIDNPAHQQEGFARASRL